MLLICILGYALPNKRIFVAWGKKQWALRHLAPYLVNQRAAHIKNVSLPKELGILPLSESVIEVKRITIRNVPGPYYNASLIQDGDGYLLFFRYDLIGENQKAYIGCARLDQHFQQTREEFITIDSLSDHAEDPRVFYKDDELYLAYNDIVASRHNCCSMHVAKVDVEKGRLEEIADLDLKLQHLEKNWVPFVYNGSMHFEYTLNPHRVLHHLAGNLTFLDPTAHKLYWPWIWGALRGGTPAIKIDDEYLGFFHSHFKDSRDKRFRWYVMGAYTFEATPPFRLKAISPYPILFEGLYDSPQRKSTLHCIFPAGIVLENKEDRDVIHVSCGENDSSIKILTFDKKALLNSLRRVSN